MLVNEPDLDPLSGLTGSIEVICGCMFSGKTEELLRRISVVKLSGKSFEMFKPETDNRYHASHIVSHNKNAIPAMSVVSAQCILKLKPNTQVVGIDEAQFFDNSLTDVCTILANQGLRVIVAGLDMDYKAAPFGPVPTLMAIAEHVTKLHAVCEICTAPASFSYRTATDERRILLGEKETYQARCRECFNLPR